MAKNASDPLGRRRETVGTFNSCAPISLFYSLSLSFGLILYATLFGVQNKLSEYFDYLHYLEAGKARASLGVGRQRTAGGRFPEGRKKEGQVNHL